MLWALSVFNHIHSSYEGTKQSQRSDKKIRKLCHEIYTGILLKVLKTILSVYALIIWQKPLAVAFGTIFKISTVSVFKEASNLFFSLKRHPIILIYKQFSDVMFVM